MDNDGRPGIQMYRKICWAISWYVMESKEFISSMTFKSKIENNELVTSN